MPWQHHPPTDEWTLQEAAAIINQSNTSSASTEQPELPLSSWMSRQPQYMFESLEGDEMHGEPLKALTDSKVGVRLSERGRLFAELKQKQATSYLIDQEIRLRVLSLQAVARSEGDAFNPASQQDFHQFMRSLPFLRKPKIFLLDNGDLRAVWKGEQGEHIGLQFLGGGEVQYVIFAKRPKAKKPSRVYGRDTFKGVLLQISAFEISDLISS